MIQDMIDYIVAHDSDLQITACQDKITIDIATKGRTKGSYAYANKVEGMHLENVLIETLHVLYGLKVVDKSNK